MSSEPIFSGGEVRDANNRSSSGVSKSPLRTPTRWARYHHKLGEILEHHYTHIAILCLSIIEVVCVVVDIMITLSLPCPASHKHSDFNDEPSWEKGLEMTTLVIAGIFFVETLLKLVAFGFSYFYKGSHWALHLLDAILITVTFILEIVLSGMGREIVGLLIVFRLWRLVKLAGTVAVGMGDIDEKRMLKSEHERNDAILEIERLKGELDKFEKISKLLKNDDDDDNLKHFENTAKSTPYVKSYTDV